MFAWWSVLPFAALLGCIAVFPLIPRMARYWHHNWFQLTVALGLGLPVGLWMLAVGEGHSVVHALVEYGQFIILLGSLYTISGGVHVAGDIRATPKNNLLMIGLGGILASVIGTTGAAMLMIRPIIMTNKERRFKVHTIVFAIFVIANCGGLLTPLGDPPLFLGFLRGVPFAWTLSLWREWLYVNGMLGLMYYGLDRKYYSQEAEVDIRRDDKEIEPIRLHGGWNLAWLAGVVGAVAFLPSLDLEAIHHGTATWTTLVPWRELIMVTMVLGCWYSEDKKVRFARNQFSWAPIKEVAALFIGIFLAMIPALKVLANMAPSLPLDHVTFFVFTGGLSSVLDNAPTYVTFFEMGKTLGGTPAVAGVYELYLVSISLGAVLCGAMTYIGNGPNFMVKSIAENSGIEMPTFFGYTLKWAFRYLAPVLVAMALIFIVQDWRGQLLGLLSTVAMAGQSVRQAYTYRDRHRHLAVTPSLSDDKAA